MLLNGVLRAKLHNNPLASYFLINLGFLLPQRAHFYNSIFLVLLVFETPWIYVFCIFLHFKQCESIVLYLRL